MPVNRYRSIEEMSRAQRQARAKFYPNGLRVIDDDVIDEVVDRVVHAFHPKRIVVFGSVARGEAGPDSDLDLFIEMESDERYVERGVAVRRVLQGMHVPMDIFVYTPAEVDAYRGRLGSLLVVRGERRQGCL
jgi:predicted nucleotidyltransferase